MRQLSDLTQLSSADKFGKKQRFNFFLSTVTSNKVELPPLHAYICPQYGGASSDNHAKYFQTAK